MSTNQMFTRTLQAIPTLFSVKPKSKIYLNKLKSMPLKNSMPPKHPNPLKGEEPELLEPPHQEDNLPSPKMMKTRKSTKRESRTRTLSLSCLKPTYPGPKRSRL